MMERVEGGTMAAGEKLREYVRMGARYVSSGTNLSFLLGAAAARANEIKSFRT